MTTIIILLSIPLLVLVDTALVVWLLSIEERVALNRLEALRSREKCHPGNPYLWASPLIDGERDYD